MRVVKHSVIAVILAACAVTATSYAQTTQQDMAQQLGACFMQLSSEKSMSSALLPLQAAVVAGKLMDTEQFRRAFEVANPGKTLDATLVVVDSK